MSSQPVKLSIFDPLRPYFELLINYCGKANYERCDKTNKSLLKFISADCKDDSENTKDKFNSFILLFYIFSDNFL